MREFLINENDSGQRVDKFLQKAMPDLPKSMMYRLIRKKDIKVHGKRCEISTKLVSGDTVRVYVRDEVAGQKQHDMSFLKASAVPQIAYEDENILIACKEVGVDSHSNGSSSGDTLIDRIKLYLYNKGEFDPSQESSFAPALCSRLDRNTSGLVTAAKNALALRLVNGAIAEGNVHKVYLCVTVAPPPKEQDIIIKAAAVADYTPESTADQKIKKSGDGMLLPLQRTKDILKYAGENKKDGQLICGFSMETEHLLENSRRKLQTKHCDMIAANSISESGAGFGVDTNRITLITENDMISLPLMSKDEVSHRILDELISMKNAKS